jgi:hypothetical protein
LDRDFAFDLTFPPLPRPDILLLLVLGFSVYERCDANENSFETERVHVDTQLLVRSDATIQRGVA